MKYKCKICGYIYDDAKEKIPFKDLPDDWKCPLCGALKSDFAPVEEEKKESKKVILDEDLDEMEGLTVAQLSALCSNLARGCEKQYKFDEMKLFMELADYFASVSRPTETTDVEGIYRRITEDLDTTYPIVSGTASEYGDRGAQRIRVWGEKVTRMLDSLAGRYLKEGEKMLENTQVWVCTICGFVYVGDEPPELCPVCKVPSWKFQKMEARA